MNYTAAPAAAIAMIIYFILIFGSVLLAYGAVALELVGMWFTFKKMGLPGWKGIIPYYNIYCQFKEVSDVKEFKKYIIFLASGFVAYIIGYFLMFFGAMFGFGGFAAYQNHYSSGSGIAIGGLIAFIFGILILLAALALLIVSIVIIFRMYTRMAHAFNLSRGWAWGMLLIPFVMFPLIGFRKDIVYYGRVDGQ